MTDHSSSGPVAVPPLEISSIDDLMAALAPLTADGSEIWYRGHRDFTWKLEASAFRTPEHRVNERSMLARFRQEAAAAGLQYSFDDWGWVTFAQHYALPTRLLDWSPSPLVALYFACERDDTLGPTDIEPDGELFSINPKKLNEDAGDVEGGHPRLLKDGDTRLDHYRPGHDGEEPGKPRAVLAPMLFDRIRFQNGTFTVAQAPSDSVNLFPLAEATSLERFVVPSGAKHSLRQQLDMLGFNSVSIYRDLDRIAERIKVSLGG